MRYAALLRGINVGGKNKVPMAALRSLLSERGFAEVTSYIASGNVLLSSELPGPAEVAAQFEALLREGFAVDTRVLVIPRERYLAIAAAGDRPREVRPRRCPLARPPRRPDAVPPQPDRRPFALPLTLPRFQRSMVASPS